MKNLLLVSFLTILYTIQLNGQASVCQEFENYRLAIPVLLPIESKPNSQVKKITKVAPSIPTSNLSINSYIQSFVNYPQAALDYGIEGSVFVSLEITRKGTIREFSFSNKIHPILKREIERVIRSIPVLNPAIVGGESIQSVVVVPFEFYLR